MKVVMVSNYLSHHQIPFCEEMVKECDGAFTFVAMEKMSSERISMGWGIEKKGFELRAYEEDGATVNRLVEDCDVLIYGGLAYSELLLKRLKTGKLTFLYTERIHKNGYNYLKLVKHLPQYYFEYGRFRNCYCLCAGGFVALDYAKTFTFINKTYKWGYFPELMHYDSCEKEIQRDNPVKILFVSRLIKWKHPEIPLIICSRLKKAGYSIELEIIGQGPLMEDVKKMIIEFQLESIVSLTESMAPHAVREHMVNSDIFIFSSDRNEGWGAVLNEAMNSMCAVVADSQIGAVPYLLLDGENGLVYRSGDIESAYRKVKYLIDNPDEMRRIAMNAYKTILNTWNASVAAERLITLSEALMAQNTIWYSDGPCSRAPIIRNGWYKE